MQQNCTKANLQRVQSTLQVDDDTITELSQ